MVTAVGQETNLDSLIKNLIYLEMDAIAAYDVTIDKLDDAGFKTQIADFRSDHHRHLQFLHDMAATHGVTPPTEGDAKEILTTGKVKMASLMGDKAILKAMKTNEDDTVTAYERAKAHTTASEAERALFSKAYNDELRHRTWMETTAAS